MALLLEDQTTTVEGASNTFTGPCTIYVRGLNGGKLGVEMSPNVTPAVWAPIVVSRVFDSAFVVEPIGGFLLRAVLHEVTPTTDCTVHAVEA
jgi:hypothetical protein